MTATAPLPRSPYSPRVTNTLIDWYSDHEIDRLAAAGITDHMLSTLLDLPGALVARGDLLALIQMGQGGHPETEEIIEWGRLGALYDAQRLINIDFPVRLARHLTDGGTAGVSLYDLTVAVHRAKREGIRFEDLPLWATAGVFTPGGAPALDPNRWPRWRSVGVTQIGLHRAALAAAAGLSPAEAVAGFDAGTLDEAGLRMLAGLRGHLPG